jgi:hypothetical protein
VDIFPLGAGSSRTLRIAILLPISKALGIDSFLCANVVLSCLCIKASNKD